MSVLEDQMMSLLTSNLVKRLSGSVSDNAQKMREFNTLVAFLINGNIPFETEYNPGNHKDSPLINLSIIINPQTKIVHTIELEGGENVFNKPVP